MCKTLRSVEDLLFELSNVKTVKYNQETSDMPQKDWVSIEEDNLHICLDAHRDERLLEEGLMRDLAQRVQALRKELDYVLTQCSGNRACG